MKGEEVLSPDCFFFFPASRRCAAGTGLSCSGAWEGLGRDERLAVEFRQQILQFQNRSDREDLFCDPVHMRRLCRQTLLRESRCQTSHREGFPGYSAHEQPPCHLQFRAPG